MIRSMAAPCPRPVVACSDQVPAHRTSDSNMTPLYAPIITSLHVYLSHQTTICICRHVNV